MPVGTPPSGGGSSGPAGPWLWAQVQCVLCLLHSGHGLAPRPHLTLPWVVTLPPTVGQAVSATPRSEHSVPHWTRGNRSRTERHSCFPVGSGLSPPLFLVGMPTRLPVPLPNCWWRLRVTVLCSSPSTQILCITRSLFSFLLLSMAAVARARLPTTRGH